MTLTMAELTARSLNAAARPAAEEEESMTNPVLTADPTATADQDPRRPLPMELAPRANHVTLVGYIYPQVRGRGKEQKAWATTRAYSRDLAQPVLERLDLLVMEEDGTTYTLELPVSSVLVRREPALFTTDVRVVVEGYLVNITKTDRRLHTLEDQAFGHVEAPQRGRSPGERSLVQYQDISIEVLTIRAATEEDVDGTWVQLRGKTTAAPAFRRADHDQRLMQARTQVLTQLRRESARLGSRAVTQVDTHLPIQVSTRLPQAAALYHPGNEVVLEGRLQPFMLQLGGTDAKLTEALARVDAEWTAQAATFDPSAKDHQAQVGRARRGYLYRRLHLQERLKVGIAVTYAELVRGKRVALAEAQQTWTRILQRRQGIQPAVTALPPVAEASAAAALREDDMPLPVADATDAPVAVIAAVDLPALVVPVESQPEQPKRRRKVVAVAMGPADDGAALAAAEATLELTEEPGLTGDRESMVERVSAAGDAALIGDDQRDALDLPAADEAAATDPTTSGVAE